MFSKCFFSLMTTILLSGLLAQSTIAWADPGNDPELSPNKTAVKRRMSPEDQLIRTLAGAAAIAGSGQLASRSLRDFEAATAESVRNEAGARTFFLVRGGMKAALGAGLAIFGGYQLYKSYKGEVAEDAPAKSVHSDLIAPIQTDAATANGSTAK